MVVHKANSHKRALSPQTVEENQVMTANLSHRFLRVEATNLFSIAWGRYAEALTWPKTELARHQHALAAHK